MAAHAGARMERSPAATPLCSPGPSGWRVTPDPSAAAESLAQLLSSSDAAQLAGSLEGSSADAAALLRIGGELSALARLVMRAATRKQRLERAAAEQLRVRAALAHNADTELAPLLLTLAADPARAGMFAHLTLGEIGRLGAVCSEMRHWSEVAQRQRAGVLAADVAAGEQVLLVLLVLRVLLLTTEQVRALRRLAETAGVGRQILLCTARYDLETEPLWLLQHGVTLLGERGVEFHREVRNSYALIVKAEDVVIQNVDVYSAGCAVSVEGGNALVARCDVRGMVQVQQDAKLRLEACVVHASPTAGVFVHGLAEIVSSTVENNGFEQNLAHGVANSLPQSGIQVPPTGKAIVSEGSRIRNNGLGLVVQGQAFLHECAITENAGSGVLAWKRVRGDARVTLTDESDVSENNSAHFDGHADLVSKAGGRFAGVDEAKTEEIGARVVSH